MDSCAAHQMCLFTVIFHYRLPGGGVSACLSLVDLSLFWQRLRHLTCPLFFFSCAFVFHNFMRVSTSQLITTYLPTYSLIYNYRMRACLYAPYLPYKRTLAHTVRCTFFCFSINSFLLFRHSFRHFFRLFSD